MATDSKNPFADLAANLGSSRLGLAAAERNFSQVMSREKFRSMSRDRSASAAQVAASGPGARPVEQRQITADAAAPEGERTTRTIAATTAPPPAPAFGGLVSNRSISANSSLAARTGTAEPAAGRGAPGSLKKAGESEGIDMSDLVDGDSTLATGSSLSQSRRIVPSEKKIVYTPQQNAVIECNDKIIVVDAFAGCAKTTTAIGYAAHRPNARMLYLCLNAANAEEARARFGPNTTCATTHSVAWGAVKPSQARVTTNFRPMLVQDQLRVNDSRTASNTIRVLNAFFNSADTEISEKHAKDVKEEKDLNDAEVTNAVAFASLAWKRMNDPADSLQMPHDAYLKMFALKAPKLAQYDTIIFDEAQDANPVTMQIVSGQKHVNLLCIGDRHQSIYAFRGSVNAMEKFSIGATRFHLSQTFRFGEKIAAVANTLLSEFKGEKVPIVGLGKDGEWNGKHTTTLSRTNAELFRLAAQRRGEGVHWVGGKVNKKTGEWIDGCHGYRLEGVMDAYHLYSRDRTQIKDPILRAKFTNWDEYVKYGEDSGDSEAKIVTKVVEEFTHDIPDLVEDIKKNAVRESRDADITLTTVHKSKGLEWGCVEISNDFEVLEETEAKLAQYANAVVPVQDINLLYVGCTRAQSSLKLNTETTEWLKKLPEHRKAREAAVSRQRADTERLNAQLRGQTAVNSAP